MRAVIAVAALVAVVLTTSSAAAEDRAMSTKVEGGYELGAMFARPVHGGRLRVGIGSQTDARAFWATLSGRYGESFAGVPTWDVRIGGDSELVQHRDLPRRRRRGLRRSWSCLAR